MKNILRIFLLTFLMAAVSGGAYAYRNPGKEKSKAPKAAGCAAGAAFADLNLNNVRARINTGGDMWWDLLDVARYFIPKNSLKTSMFSASLWIGGLDVNGQLKLAAQRYRGNGNDYWPGPLSIDGTASVDPETCTKYDKHFKITRSEIDQFVAWFSDPASFPDYTIPRSILEWPAHGDISKNQSYYLAPFWDQDGDGNYDPYQGDYPYYDLDNSLCPRNPENIGKPPAPTMEGMLGIVQGGILADQVIKGDQTLWWVFNDKGNIHSETQGAPIGLEIRAQAFAFATNDEINNMTFYSYEIINRSTFRLTETYFSQWVDTDLGDAWDDYVGCDVQRGLGYCYNGKAVDGTGKDDHYGVQPPAVGVDFFQGPYMDPDGLDNPKVGLDGTMICDVSINGINFGDSIVDNERFGMRRFVYHNNLGGYWAMTDPEDAAEYYNLLRGIWKDGIKMRYGGNAHPNSGATGPDCDFMFPADTDPCNWGTGGIQPAGFITGAGGSGVKWTEETAGNEPYDRRFMQSAGPFTLEPGAVNYITVGIPWARASSGGPFASVELLRIVDDKCQALFDNCFKVVDGPDAPDLVAQELDREVILFLSNRKTSNNYLEAYKEIDPNIPENKVETTTDYIYDTATGQYTQVITLDTFEYDRYYRFEGYQIFQVANGDVDVSELGDPDVSRIVAQCDLENGVSKLVNYYYNEELQASIPVMEVSGEDKGVAHSFRLLEDQFATGDRRLVNHKQYYYIAIAYAYNEYAPYSQEPGVLNGLYGQKKPYLAGRKSPTGRIQSITVIPHKTSPEAEGTILNSSYGDGPKITRIEGQGNGGLELELTRESIDALMAKTDPPYIITEPTYENGKGPVNVKVIDPLNVAPGNFSLKFNVEGNNINNATWTLTNTTTGEVWESQNAISINNEQLIPELGLSIQVAQPKFPGDTTGRNTGYITSSISFDDSTKQWLTGIADRDDPGPYNWIRAGILEDPDNPTNNDWKTGSPFDPREDFEKIVGGTWGPYTLCAQNSEDIYGPAFDGPSRTLSKMANLFSVDIVITSDQSKWTRCPVIEMCPDKNLAQGGAKRFANRASQSVDKNGNPAPVGSGASNNPNDPNFISETGMGWFPGYAINVETGERLNIAFGENSWFSQYNGRDMIWNPSFIASSLFETVLGGMHYVYVFGHNTGMEPGYPEFDAPAYDHGAWARNLLADDNFRRYAYANVMWVNIPLQEYGEDYLATDVTTRIRVARPYQKNWSVVGSDNPVNNNFPLYTFSTNDIAATTNSNSAAVEALDIINIVPNPYYGYSGYEVNQLDNRVKITNLPERCTVTIYNISGTRIRQYSKDDASTFIDWDMKNHAGIPIAGGIYLIHVDVPGVGEKVIKWFGSLRPVDLNSF
jgi:hypothetical protein